MESVILVIHLIVALSIIVIVLIQPSEAGGFLGSGGSMSNMMAPRRSGDVLTRMTTILAGIFFLTSLSLAIIAEHRGPAKSILEELPPVPATQTAPATQTTPATPAAAVTQTTPAAEKPASAKTAPDTAAPKAAPAPKKAKPVAPISK